MHDFDELTINAYVDGELDGDDLIAFEKALKNSEDLQASVAELMQVNSILHTVLDPVQRVEPPKRLAEAVQSGSKKTRSRFELVEFRLPSLIAASLACLMLGGVGGFYGAQQSEEAPEQFVSVEEIYFHANRRSVLQSALEYQPSGQLVNWQDQASEMTGSVSLVRTFKNKKGQYCREYKEMIDQAGTTRSWSEVSCREGKENWQPHYRVIPLNNSSF